MRPLSEYKHDVFLSWTGADRELKDRIVRCLEGRNLKCYDSDKNCHGDFLANSLENVGKTKTFLLILSDSLRSDPTRNEGKYFSLVKKELQTAEEYESRGWLNILVFNLSSFYKFDGPYSDPDDPVGTFYYLHTRGCSRDDAKYENGEVTDESIEHICNLLEDAVNDRNAGRPQIPHVVKSMVENDALPADAAFRGRGDELEKISGAFGDGAKVVVLSGMGGIGKSKLAEKFVCEYADPEKNGTKLRFLQIVRIQDFASRQNSSDNGLKLVVSSVVYSSDFKKQIENSSESEKYKRSLSALRELPEFTIIILDNFNNLTEDALAEIVQNVNCRLLITKRGALDEKFLNKTEENKKLIRQIKVENLEFDDAYEMFKTELGDDIPREKFNDVFVHVGGHTITLCIIAKIMRTQRKSADEILSEMNKMGDMTELIDFAHNSFEDEASGEKLSIMQHLSKLFFVSRLSDGCKEILKNMSLLSDGRMPLAALQKAMGNLKDINDVNTLRDFGWLELTFFYGVEYAVIHPLLSRLVAEMLKPDEEACGGVIDYLCGLAAAGKSELTYSDMRLMCDKLYFAIFRLAESTGRLHGGLWQAFTMLAHISGGLDELDAKRVALGNLLKEGRDINTANSFYSMVLMERRPTKLDVLEKYVNTLTENAQNYKWILCALSVTAQHLIGRKEYIPRLNAILKTALKEAMIKEDDLGVYNLSVILTLTDKVPNEIYSYIKRRKKQSGDSGYIILTEQLLMADGLSFKNVSPLDMFGNIMENIYSNPVKSGLKLFLRHPIKTISNIKRTRELRERAHELPDSDPMKEPLKALDEIYDALDYEDKFDAQSVFDYAMGLFKVNYENGMTFASQQRIMENVLGLMSRLPAPMRTEIRLIASEDFADKDVRLLTVGDISRIYVSFYINANYQYKEAIEQSRRIVEIEKTLRAPGDIHIIEALIQNGETCKTFGLYEEAISSYREAYDILKVSAPDSAILCSTCFDIIMCINSLISQNFAVDWARIDEVRATHSGFFVKESPEVTFLSGAIANAMLCGVFGYSCKGKGTAVTSADVRAAIYGYIPRLAGEIADKYYFGLPQNNRSAEALNNALKNELYPDNMSFLLTEQDLARLGREGAVCEISRRVQYALAVKMGDIEINMGIRIGYKAVIIEKSLFENILYNSFLEQFTNGGKTEEEFTDNILNRLCKELVKLAADNSASKYFYTYSFMDTDIRAGRSDWAYTNIPQEGQPVPPLPEREYISAPKTTGVTDEFKKAVHSIYGLADTGTACNRFFELMRRKKSFNALSQTAIWARFEDVFIILSNITIVLKGRRNQLAVFAEKCKKLYEECFDVCKYLCLNGKTDLLKTRAYISYNFQLGLIAEDKTKGLKYLRAAIKKSVQKHVLPGEPLYVSADMSICAYVKAANGDLTAFADSILGKSGKYRADFELLTGAVLESCEGDTEQNKKDIFEKICGYIKSPENYRNNYGISNADFRRIKSEKEYYFNVLGCAIKNIWGIQIEKKRKRRGG